MSDLPKQNNQKQITLYLLQESHQPTVQIGSIGTAAFTKV